MSRSFLLLVSTALIGGACSKEAAPEASDASRPAVVQGPPVVIPADTARPDTLMSHLERTERAKRELAGQYALLGAAAVMADARLVAEFYAPQALMRIGDSIFVGQIGATEGYMRFLRRNSIGHMDRVSVKIETVGNVYRDSGEYTLKSQRAGARTVEEVGIYLSEWVRTGSPERWILQKDQLNRTRPKR